MKSVYQSILHIEHVFSNTFCNLKKKFVPTKTRYCKSTRRHKHIKVSTRSLTHRKYCNPTKMPTKDPNLIIDEALETNGNWTQRLIKRGKEEVPNLITSHEKNDPLVQYERERERQRKKKNLERIITIKKNNIIDKLYRSLQLSSVKTLIIYETL